MTLNHFTNYFTATICLIVVGTFGISPTVAAQKTSYAHGLMNVLEKGVEEPVPICMVYPNELYPLKTVPEQKYNLSYEKEIDLCQDGLTVADFTPKKADSLILLSVSTNCSISRYYDLISEGKAAGVILLSNYTATLNQTYGWDIFAVVRNDDIYTFKKVVHPNEDIQIEVMQLGFLRFDPSLLVLWLIAVVCVGVGSYTGPYRILNLGTGVDHDQEVLGAASEPKDGANDAKVYEGITIPVAIGLVLFISTTLLLLYFFYQYLVYFFIFVFCLASCRAMYLLAIQLITYCAPGIRFPKIWKFGIHEIIVAAISITLPTVWFVFRHDGWVWPIQNILGICFCIHLIQTLHLPNMKIITSLLVLLFIYDVFFVFITPYFTANGKSVMVEVATGVSSSGSKEQLPMLLQFPRLLNAPGHACVEGREYSLLGYGDIIVPGFLVCFAHVFDLQTRKDGGGRPYFITSLIAYAVGLGAAFVALILSSTGQPALFYIVPCILLAIFSLGLIKKEVKALWRGGPLVEPLPLEHESA